MGAWGTGSFENDDALNFLDRLEGHGVVAVTQAFREVTSLDADDYVEVDSASSAIAAAELVAAGHDGEVSQLPEPARQWLDKHHGSVATPDIQSVARRAVERVLMGSELKDLWSEGDDDAEAAAWEQSVRDLIQRLQASS